MDFIHKRDLPGITSRYLTHWGNRPLKGLYLIESTLTKPLGTTTYSSVFLNPGVFDPVRGEYGEDLIAHLLNNMGTGIVYEAHFQHNGVCGLLDMDTVIDDLKYICLNQQPGGIMIGLSAGAVIVTAALLLASQEQKNLPLAGVFLIGPYVSGYDTIFVKIILRVFKNEKKLAKITRHAGHDQVPRNVFTALDWIDGSYLHNALQQATPKNPNQNIRVPVEFNYFRYDGLSRKGRAKLQALFNSPAPGKPFAGIHRGLFQVPETNQVVGDFVKRHSIAIEQPANSDVAPSVRVSQSIA
ncbi:MAG: hypothetical protein COB04_15030 [Gammaproteobacteria bacterium]|nr:MAG: hypothetical protein COB04_15030 [Gammaproteobacteria bacterium]